MAADRRDEGDRNPFIRYRHRLDTYRAVTEGRLSDDRFVELVTGIDDAVAAVDGRRFGTTPIIDGADLFAAIGRRGTGEESALGRLTVKVEIDQVGRSHKARHLFGVALAMVIDEELGARKADRLAIASCGNAALAAGVVAAALDRRLEVYVPTWAEQPVVDRLTELDAEVVRCPRDGRPGDPAFNRFAKAVADGARPFSVQAVTTPGAFDGGRTLGWELADQAPDIDRLYVQVGGGALATSVSRALPDAALHPVQADGCAPLARAWDRLAPDFDFDGAALHPERYMWPWDNPASAATGILDDITYDWLPLLRRTIESGGRPVVATEAHIIEAHRLAREVTGLPVSATGTAGLAGLMQDLADEQGPDRAHHTAVLFTGYDYDA